MSQWVVRVGQTGFVHEDSVNRPPSKRFEIREGVHSGCIYPNARTAIVVRDEMKALGYRAIARPAYLAGYDNFDVPLPP